MSSSIPRVDLASLQIPSLPDVVARLQGMMSDPDSGLSQIGAVIATDPPLAARVLRTANSAVYSLREPVQTLQRAAAVLGIRALRNIVLQMCLMDTFRHLAEDERLDLERLWRHSVAAAVVAQELGLGARSRLVDPYDAYTCGLLHDLGKLVLFESCRESYAAVIRQVHEKGTAPFDVELERLGVTHAQVGGMLALEWNLPDEIVQSIRLHHASRRELALAPMAALVALSNGLVLAVERGLPFEELEGHPGARLLRLDLAALERAAERAGEAWRAVEV